MKTSIIIIVGGTKYISRTFSGNFLFMGSSMLELDTQLTEVTNASVYLVC